MPKSNSRKIRDNNPRIQLIRNPENSFRVIPRDIGHQQCFPGLTNSRKRTYTMVHYVYSGKGTYEKDGKVYHLSKGDAFVICEGWEATYTADMEDPWHYYWLQFNTGSFGDKFENMECPVVKITNEYIFTEPIARMESGTLTVEFLIGMLYCLYDEVFSPKIPSSHIDYATQIAGFINTNYTKKLSVESLAESFGLNRSHLSRLFKKKHGISIKQYIINARMTKATELLKTGVSVKEAAFMSGYEDALAFSRMFKKVYGISPKEFIHNNSRM